MANECLNIICSYESCVRILEEFYTETSNESGNGDLPKTISELFRSVKSDILDSGRETTFFMAREHCCLNQVYEFLVPNDVIEERLSKLSSPIT